MVKGASGVIKRINAAVVVNHQASKDEKGKATNVPLSAEQIEKMTALVREAVGFSKDRGDSVNLMNAAFAPDTTEVVEIPLWKQPEVLETARSFAWPLGTLAMAALVMLGLIRPAMKSMNQPPVAATAESAGNQLDAIEADQPERPDFAALTVADPAHPSPSEQRLEDARKLTRDNPAAVANIVKAWMNGEAPA